MTLRLAGWVTAFVVGTGSLGVAQKVVGPEDFDRAMKTIGAALEGVEEALGSASYVDAKTPLALLRQVLASTRPEWEANGQPDAVRMTRETLAALDALDRALSATTVDAAAATAAFADVTRACDACHATYREGDAQTGYRIRSAVSSGAPTHAQEADLVSLQADPAQWVMPNGNYAAWNYSPLDQITADNVHDLSVVWTLPLPILDSHQAAPLVVGDTMYIVTPKPNHVYAIDLARDGVIEWEFRAELEDLELITRRACCGAQTRGLAYADGKLFFNTLDGQAVALDASTGQVLWRDDPTDYPASEVRTGAPLVAGRNVIFGVSGGDRGVRGHVTAYDIDTGEVRWRYHNLGPNEDVGIGPRFRPFYADDRIPNPALDSWYGDSWRLGGGAVWGWFSYDPELNYVYYGTGNCGPWNPDYRREWGVIDLDEHGGLATYRNNYCASVLARDATTGELIWAYNVTPQDQWDLDEMSAGVLVDLALGGRTRRTMIRASRNGYFYVLDRATGELLAEPWAFAPNDIMQGVDLETGRARYNIDKINFTDLEDRRRYVPDAENTTVAWCPGLWARNWQNDAYSPRTGLLYTSTSNRCGAMRVVEGEYVPGERYNLRASGGPPEPSPRGDHVDELQANDPVSGRTVWRAEWPTANNTPVMATAGDLVFQGGADQGVLRAFDARTGDIVWTFRTGTGFQSSAISYLGPDGRQYLAIIASSRASDPLVALDTPPDAASRYRRAGTTLYVFALPPSVAASAER